MNAEERWERIATVLLWTAIAFVALAGYGIYDGDDARGIAMTLVPAAIVFGLWYLATRRRDQIVHGEPTGVIGWIASGVLVLAGIAYIVARVVGSAATSPPIDTEPTAMVLAATSRPGRFRDPNGSGAMPSLVRKHHAPH